MEVADRIVVLNHGRVEQSGPPRELYERPANAFVMGFLGPVARLGDTLVRPHDLRLLPEPLDGALEAQVARVVHLGFEVRVELVAGDGERLWAQVTRDACEQLELAAGQIVYVRPTRSASDVSSSTPRMLARSSIQTSRRATAGPL